jgi:hypothetical protein
VRPSLTAAVRSRHRGGCRQAEDARETRIVEGRDDEVGLQATAIGVRHADHHQARASGGRHASRGVLERDGVGRVDAEPAAGFQVDVGSRLSAGVSSADTMAANLFAKPDDRHRRALPTIIAGDLNSVPDSASVRYLTGRQALAGRSAFFHDAWAGAGEGPGHTWTSANPICGSLQDIIVRQPGGLRWRIDYVLVGFVQHGAHSGSHCRITAASVAFHHAVDGVWPSDHFGVLVDVELGHDPEAAAALDQLLTRQGLLRIRTASSDVSVLRRRRGRWSAGDGCGSRVERFAGVAGGLECGRVLVDLGAVKRALAVGVGEGWEAV